VVLGADLEGVGSDAAWKALAVSCLARKTLAAAEASGDGQAGGRINCGWCRSDCEVYYATPFLEAVSKSVKLKIILLIITFEPAV